MSEVQNLTMPQTANMAAVDALAFQLPKLPQTQNRLPRLIFLSPPPERIREIAQNEGCDI
jgi:hypothetical protein